MVEVIFDPDEEPTGDIAQQQMEREQTEEAKVQARREADLNRMALILRRAGYVVLEPPIPDKVRVSVLRADGRVDVYLVQRETAPASSSRES